MSTGIREAKDFNPPALVAGPLQPGPSIDTIRRLLLPKGSDQELELLAMVCRRTGLDPFTGQIRALSRRAKNDAGQWEERLSIQIGIDGFRLIAERTGDYAGQVGPQWCGADGVWKDVWLSNDPPAAARVGVIRKGFAQPVYAIARWASYAQTNREGQLTRMWAAMPDLMIAKCAESLALRKAFPNELSGLYTDDEMAQAQRPAAVQQKPSARKQLDSLVAELAAERNIPVDQVEAGLLTAAKQNTAKAPDTIDDFSDKWLAWSIDVAGKWLAKLREAKPAAVSDAPRSRDPGEDDGQDDGPADPEHGEPVGQVQLGGRLPDAVAEALLREIHDAGLTWDVVVTEGLGIIGRRLLRDAHISSLSLDDAQRVRDWVAIKRKSKGRAAKDSAAA